MKHIKVLFFVVAFVATAFSNQSNWKIDAVHSSVQFSVSHMVISEVTGTFNQFDGTVFASNEDFSDAKIEVTIQAKSVDTQNEGRDKHLQNTDFFDVEKFPTITFKSKSIEKAEGKNMYKITGDLTMKGITKQVVLDAKYNGTIKDMKGNLKAGFKATTTINRMDYGVNWSKSLDAGGLVVGETVDITLNIELDKQTQK